MPPVSHFDAMEGQGWSRIPSVASKHEKGGWWVAETSPHSKHKKVGLVVDLRLTF